MNKDLEYFFNASIKSIRIRARIVFWQEYAVSVMAEYENEFIDRAKRHADRHKRSHLQHERNWYPLLTTYLAFLFSGFKNTKCYINKTAQLIRSVSIQDLFHQINKTLCGNRSFYFVRDDAGGYCKIDIDRLEYQAWNLFLFKLVKGKNQGNANPIFHKLIYIRR